MQVVSFNANGIRSALNKGWADWVLSHEFDVICLQETKAQMQSKQVELPEALNIYHQAYLDAEKKGYSGVGILSRQQPDEIRLGFGEPLLDMDQEGRFVAMRFGQLWIASVYLPSGSSGEERQAVKFTCLDRLMPILREWLASGYAYILCGDFNIAHQAIDLKNWKGNQKNSGFLPEERAWFTAMLAEGWVDAFRHLYPETEQYTWWSNRGQAYAKNVGWRIDYQIITPNLVGKLKSANVYTAEKFSDHAPLIIEYS